MKNEILIEQARNLPISEWYKVTNLIIQADNDDTKKELKAIRQFMYDYDTNDI